MGQWVDTHKVLLLAGGHQIRCGSYDMPSLANQKCTYLPTRAPTHTLLLLKCSGYCLNCAAFTEFKIFVIHALMYEEANCTVLAVCKVCMQLRTCVAWVMGETVFKRLSTSGRREDKALLFRSYHLGVGASWVGG